MVSSDYNEKIEALGIEISVSTSGGRDDYISLTDIARHKSNEPKMVIQNWMRTRSTIEYLGVWEQLNNPGFKGVEFDAFRNEAGSNAFVMTPTKWISATSAIGIRVRRGRYGGGTFAHADIGFEFASWVSPEFKLYIIKDYQRLKADENSRLSLEWNERRLFSKLNYRIHTDAIKGHLLPTLKGAAEKFAYANEADALNVAAFGKTAKQWRDDNFSAEGNIRDYATLHELIVIANLESMNAQLLKEGMSRPQRAEFLREIAREQLAALQDNPTLKKLGDNSLELTDGK